MSGVIERLRSTLPPGWSVETEVLDTDRFPFGRASVREYTLRLRSPRRLAHQQSAYVLLPIAEEAAECVAEHTWKSLLDAWRDGKGAGLV